MYVCPVPAAQMGYNSYQHRSCVNVPMYEYLCMYILVYTYSYYICRLHKAGKQEQLRDDLKRYPKLVERDGAFFRRDGVALPNRL